MRKDINAYRNLVSKLGRVTWVPVDHTKTYLQEIWGEDTHWIVLAYDTVHWRAVGNATRLRNTDTHWYIHVVIRYLGKTKFDF
jgi:hypothetical protein